MTSSDGPNITDLLNHILIRIEKWRVDNETVYFPQPGMRIEKGLTAYDHSERFLLTVNRSNVINENKITYQLRTNNSIILLRLDIDGSPHKNPNEERMACPHLHVMNEENGDNWAFPIPRELIGNLSDLFMLMNDFMKLGHITRPPNIMPGLI